MKIYVASSWRNEYQPAIVELLRNAGHEVYDFRNPSEGNSGFKWSDIDKDWLKWDPVQYKEALRHPIAESGFKSDFDAMKWADACVMVLPCGRSANTEAGWMKGAGKKVFVFIPIPQEPELMYKIYDDVISDYNQLLNALSTSTDTSANTENEIPRRNQHNLLTLPERNIKAAMASIELLEPSPVLTEAVIKLDVAFNLVADYVDSKNPEWPGVKKMEA